MTELSRREAKKYAKTVLKEDGDYTFIEVRLAKLLVESLDRELEYRTDPFKSKKKIKKAKLFVSEPKGTE
jgi:hypothetical protein